MRRRCRNDTGRERFCRPLARACGLVLLFFGCVDERVDQREPATPQNPHAALETQIRVVSLSPLATRFVIEIGAARHLVAVDAASHALPGLSALEIPVATQSNLADFAPEIVLTPQERTQDVLAAHSTGGGPRVIEFAPHDMEDVFALCRSLGRDLVGLASATSFERRISRPLALIGGRSPSVGRPRVLALTRIEPMRLAGGHSFETDLIETAGGSSLTHGGDETSIETTPTALRELAPDLILVTSRDPPADAEKARARAAIPEELRVAYFDFDRETYWLRTPSTDAERLRSLFLALGLERPSY